ncbi:MAG TPA: PQQ-dependent sugar dehydrogenase [Gemmatimonadaceae bacterium]|nr:PQQ-dependent sugar dehydrogenase [Gemmatimonadaceae bacterium]
MKRPLVVTIAAAGILSLAAFVSLPSTPPCTSDNAGLKLPSGFCATLFADSLSAPRHMVVAPNGDVIVAIRNTQKDTGGVVVLRDADGDGKAEARAKFGKFNATEVRLLGSSLYTETSTDILRYAWRGGSMQPSGEPDTIVTGLPTMGHAAKTFVIHNGQLLVNQGSRTNSCQEKDRTPQSKGLDPCPELQERAGIWRYSAEKKGQTLKDGERFATGIRNAVALAIEPKSNELYAVQHGRDNLAENWGFTAEKSAETPAEELLHVTRGADFGWPYCYFDRELRKRVLAPEYGGDGNAVGRCEGKQGNVGTFPGHWAPDGMLFYTGSALPARYRDGVFVVFHGSWNRAPLPQQGFKVVFQPMANGRASGDFETFIDGFMASDGKPTDLGGRPMGIAQGRNGELYLSDDSRGRIWRIQYSGGGPRP